MTATVFHSGKAAASSFKLLGSAGTFEENAGGLGPFSSDAAGNLYTPSVIGEGALFELTESSGYTESKLIYTFNFFSPEGGFPNAVTVTSHNVILGTTMGGGGAPNGVVYNLGTARKISATVLHAFSGEGAKPTDGSIPQSGLTKGPFSRYYGTTLFGGAGAKGSYAGDGTAYEISSSITDPHYRLLHRFGGAGDGINPTPGALAVDAEGRLYGETFNGGANGAGAVFTLQYVKGGWQERVIYSFRTTNDLYTPTANLAVDAAGNLYGCAEGGTHGQGGIFELTAPTQSSDSWQETVLYNFGDHQNDPVAAFTYTPDTSNYGCGISIDQATNLIVGQSPLGGTRNKGTIFLLMPPAPGQTTWTESVGHDFADGKGSQHPSAPLIKVDGVYYGGGGDSNEVYAFTP